MKICLVPDLLPGLHETWSGAGIVCLRLSQMLQEEGHDVIFVTSMSKKKNTSGQIYQIPRPLMRFGHLSRTFPFSVSSLLHSIVALRQSKPDVVHLHTKYLFLPVLLSAIILKIPVVLTVVDYFIICPTNILRKRNGQICTHFHDAQCFECFARAKPPLWHPKAWTGENSLLLPISSRKAFSLSRSVIFDYLVRKLKGIISLNVLLLPVFLQKAFWVSRSVVLDYFVRKLDALVTFSETSKARLEQYGLPGGKISVIYQYRLDWKIDEQKSVDNSFQNPTILFAGSLHEHKGFHIIVEAMSYVVEKVPDARLMAVGAGDPLYVERIHDMMGSLGLGESIQLLGKKENREVMQLMDRSDLVVVAEQWPSDFGPVVLVEAMALGKPIVASRIGGIPEFIEDGISGFLATHDQPREFADKIVWLLRHKESAQAMGENAKNSAKFLYDGKVAKEMTDLYHRVVSRYER